MANDPALLIAFDDNGDVIWVEPRGQSKVYDPQESFEDYPEKNVKGTPLTDINLLYVKAFDILIYEKKDADGKIIRMSCPHVRCRRYCC